MLTRVYFAILDMLPERNERVLRNMPTSVDFDTRQAGFSLLCEPGVLRSGQRQREGDGCRCAQDLLIDHV